MIAPSSRTIWIIAALIVPVLTLAGIEPPFLAVAALIVVALSAVLAFDAVKALRAVTTTSLATPKQELKWFKGRDSAFSLRVQNRRTVIIAPELPPAIECSNTVQAVSSAGHVSFNCTPQRRGTFQITRVWIGSLSRWKLWRTRSEKPVSITIRVFPDLEREAGAKLLMFRKAGLRTHRQVGRGRDFERLREYVHGDNFDEIYWKATARRGRPVVKVFQAERTQDVYVILDSSRLSARHEALERFVTAALMLALAADNEGDNFGLVTFSGRVETFVPASRGRTHFSRCREAIFDLQPTMTSPDLEELFTFLQLSIRKRSLLLFLTDLSDPLLAETFAREAPVLARRHVVLVNSLRDPQLRPLFTGELPATVDEVRARLAAHLEWATLKKAEKNLGVLGISLSSISPSSVGMDLVRSYADVKRRQVL